MSRILLQHRAERRAAPKPARPASVARLEAAAEVAPSGGRPTPASDEGSV